MNNVKAIQRAEADLKTFENFCSFEYIFIYKIDKQTFYCRRKDYMVCSYLSVAVDANAVSWAAYIRQSSPRRIKFPE